MQYFEMIIENDHGLHARPASLLVKCTTLFKSKITITSLGEKVDAKSILGIILLAAEKGRKLSFEIDGIDEHEVVTALKQLLTDKNFCEG